MGGAGTVDHLKQGIRAGASAVAAGSMLQWTFGEGMTVRYDVTDNFPNFDDMNDCQQRIVLNGVKQRLADSIAGCKVPSDRFESIVLKNDVVCRFWR
jgi:hypothetical protein